MITSLCLQGSRCSEVHLYSYWWLCSLTRDCTVPFFTWEYKYQLAKWTWQNAGGQSVMNLLSVWGKMVILRALMPPRATQYTGWRIINLVRWKRWFQISCAKINPLWHAIISVPCGQPVTWNVKISSWQIAFFMTRLSLMLFFLGLLGSFAVFLIRRNADFLIGRYVVVDPLLH